MKHYKKCKNVSNFNNGIMKVIHNLLRKWKISLNCIVVEDSMIEFEDILYGFMLVSFRIFVWGCKFFFFRRNWYNNYSINGLNFLKFRIKKTRKSSPTRRSVSGQIIHNQPLHHRSLLIKSPTYRRRRFHGQEHQIQRFKLSDLVMGHSRPIKISIIS